MKRVLHWVGIINQRDNVIRDNIFTHILPKMGRKMLLVKLFINYLYSKLVVSALTIQEEMKISKPSSHALIVDFVLLGILKEKTGLKKIDYMVLRCI